VILVFFSAGRIALIALDRRERIITGQSVGQSVAASECVREIIVFGMESDPEF
jgi:hypothetical protein